MTAPRELGWRRRLPEAPGWTRRVPRVRRVPRAGTPDPILVGISYGLTILSLALLVMVLNVTLVSQLQHFTAQHRLYDELRLNLAQGSTPIGQTDAQGALVEPGTPMALLKIPDLGIREVIVEGAASRQTKMGIGHRPDTPLPGQPGASVLMGRSSAYGGVFGQIDKLRPGQTFTVLTGQGQSTYKVLGVRGQGSKLPALTGDAGSLVLMTASGPPFLPHKTVLVDAELVSKSFPRPALAFNTYKPTERPLASDPGRMFSLSWLMELLVLFTVGGVWAWKRWGHPGTWIVFAPMVGATALACADRVSDLLPNLM
ncbi:MAG: sortase [Nocardioidaceae bacterium]|nr:sortase [Nocardioidaceae bacterium]